MNNFSTLTSIISALSTAPIGRLTRTWAQVNARTMTVLEQMRKLMHSTKNFGEYREALHLANPPCIPFFGKLVAETHSSSQLTVFTRCLPYRLDIHRRRYSLCDQTHRPHQFCQTSQNRRRYSRYSAISKCALRSQVCARSAGLHIE